MDLGVPLEPSVTGGSDPPPSPHESATDNETGHDGSGCCVAEPARHADDDQKPAENLEWT